MASIRVGDYLPDCDCGLHYRLLRRFDYGFGCDYYFGCRLRAVLRMNVSLPFLYLFRKVWECREPDRFCKTGFQLL